MTDLQRENILKSLAGWCSNEKRAATEKLIAEMNPKLIVEIGTFGGSWLLPVSIAAPNAKCIGIDPYDAGACIEGMTTQQNVEWWNNQRMLDGIYHGVQSAKNILGLGDHMRIFRDRSDNPSVLKFFGEDTVPLIDLLHIDGNHSAAPAMRDAQLYLPKVRIGGVIICDDVGWTESGVLTVKPMVDWLLANGCEFMYEVTGAAFLRKVK